MLIEGPCGGTLTYTYDAENRIVTTAGVTYTYDRDGKRVKKSNGKLYWTGTGSDALAESDLAGNISETRETRGQTGRFLIFSPVMARLARVVGVDVPHHVTQRGNARQRVLSDDDERRVYLELLAHSLSHSDVSLLGYCLMSNHVHLVRTPHQGDALAQVLKHTHARTLRDVLERTASIQRACLARALLFVPDGCGVFVERAALRGAEPRASANGSRGGVVAVVECRGALWWRAGSGLPEHAKLEEAMVAVLLAAIPRRARVGT